MRIVVAMDASPASSYVLDEAAARPWPAGSEFSVIHVVDEAHFGNLPTLAESANREAGTLVKAAANRLSRAGHKAHPDVMQGATRTRISDFAKQWKADLIMVGAHGQGALARFLLGSVARDTLRLAPCSVEIVRPNASGKPASSRAMKILLATDGSECSNAAAKSVAHQPWPSGSEIRILSVEELPVFEYPADASSLSPVYPPVFFKNSSTAPPNAQSRPLQGTADTTGGGAHGAGRSRCATSTRHYQHYPRGARLSSDSSRVRPL